MYVSSFFYLLLKLMALFLNIHCLMQTISYLIDKLTEKKKRRKKRKLQYEKFVMYNTGASIKDDQYKIIQHDDRNSFIAMLSPTVRRHRRYGSTEFRRMEDDDDYHTYQSPIDNLRKSSKAKGIWYIRLRNYIIKGYINVTTSVSIKWL